MERLLKDEIKSRFATNIVQSRKFSELLVDSLAKYRNRAIETAQAIEELIAMAKQFNEAARRGEEVSLNDVELAVSFRRAGLDFYHKPVKTCSPEAHVVSLIS